MEKLRTTRQENAFPVPLCKLEQFAFHFTLQPSTQKYSMFAYVTRNTAPSDHCLSQCRPPKVNGQSKKQPSALL